MVTILSKEKQMNQVILKGNLTRDPELKVISSKGKEVSVVNFSIALNKSFKKADGSWDNDVTFIDCEAWDTAAENIAKKFFRGSCILIENGSLKTESWEKDGQPRSKTKVRVNRFSPIPKAPPRDDAQAASSEAISAGLNTGGNAEIPEDDIPF